MVECGDEGPSLLTVLVALECLTKFNVECCPLPDPGT